MKLSPLDASGPFGKLLKDMRLCKAKKTCPGLRVRTYYFEPNPETAIEWLQEDLYKDGIDSRVVFVCESPNRSSKGSNFKGVERDWVVSGGTGKRFMEVRKTYGLENCYITNSVKCGTRKGSRHTDSELHSCGKFLIRELELIHPLVVVAVGGNAMYSLRKHVFPQLKVPPCLFQITHYAARGNVWESWQPEFENLMRLISRLKPRSQWKL
jgi:uracil-DNA glycosylase family 4